VHLTSSPVDWYAARAGGIAAYLMLSAVVCLGLTMSGKRTRRWPKFALEDVHRFAGLLVGAFVTLHVVTIAIDSWLPFAPAQVIVPFTDRYRPLWVGLGIVAAELLLALAITNHYRDRLPYWFWRRAHYLNFAVWGAATIHGIASGTDRSAVWLLALYAPAVATVTALIALRIGGRRPASLVAAASAAGFVVGLALGPFHFHAKTWNASRFQDTLDGQILVQRGVTEEIVSMAGNGKGPQRVLVRADLLVRPTRLAATAFQLEYLPSGSLCKGKVRQVRPTGFDATCRLAGGARRVVTADWQLTNEGGGLAGTIAAHA
jgi:methionine sulfoxide reductase heme-binding subunit